MIHIRTLGEPGNKAGLLLAYTEFYVKIIRAKNALAHCEVILVTQFLMLIKDTVFLLNENWNYQDAQGIKGEVNHCYVCAQVFGFVYQLLL